MRTLYTYTHYTCVTMCVAFFEGINTKSRRVKLNTQTHAQARTHTHTHTQPPTLTITHNSVCMQVKFFAFAFGGSKAFFGKDIAFTHRDMVLKKGLSLAHFDKVLGERCVCVCVCARARACVWWVVCDMCTGRSASLEDHRLKLTAESPPSLPPPLSLTHTHTHALSHTHTHTHTHRAVHFTSTLEELGVDPGVIAEAKAIVLTKRPYFDSVVRVRDMLQCVYVKV